MQSCKLLLLFSLANFMVIGNGQQYSTEIKALLQAIQTKVQALETKLTALDTKQTASSQRVEIKLNELSQVFNQSQTQCSRPTTPAVYPLSSSILSGAAGGKLRLKVSGRNFQDLDNGFGTTDPYFELFLSTDGGATEAKLLKSDTVSDKENPDWGQVIEVDFNRRENQWLRFNVWDEDHLRDDDRVGSVWINLADYVDKGQVAFGLLDKIDSGYLIIHASDQPIPNIPVVPGKVPGAPAPPTPPRPQSLRFKLSASDLPTKDDVGFIPGNSDPYVVIYKKKGLDGGETEIARSGTVASTRTPMWGDIFTIPVEKNSEDTRLVFRIYDEDNLRVDSKLGVAYIEIADIAAKGTIFSHPLIKKGILTITKV
ncbi:uncharacterized protein LOC110853866 [Folsomia candida]|uniref:Copine-5 n=1 Tax=Folsomia candida TaxID=158441 RepID=A0A226DY92_FOLCA|nr:uncharacterized protein LOC110853866 [Folsomia candida]OXA50189.1 Copine-5 [Folsomia candida]